MSRWKKLLRTGLKVAVAAGVSFLLLEGIFLAFPDFFFPDRFYVYDSELGFKVRPHARYGNARANEFGFNDRDYSRPAPEGVFRVLVLSDSFNWAGGPVDNCTNVLEEQLEKTYGQGRVEVIAAGYPMTHTAEQLALLKKFGLLYQPDLVVLGFYTGNDFFDGRPQRRRVAYGGTFVDYNTDQDFFFELWGRPVLFRSRFFSFLGEKYVLWRNQRSIQREQEEAAKEKKDPKTAAEAPKGEQEKPAPVKPARVKAAPAGRTEPGAPSASLPPSMARSAYLELIHDQVQFADRQRAAIFDPYVDYILGALEEMKSLLGQRDIPLVVVAYPAEWHIDESLRREMLQRFELPDERFEWTRAQRLLEEFCHRHGIDFHDLAAVFRQARREGRQLYLPADSHWNPEGNRLAAEQLFQIVSAYVEN
ncbi:MAG TPA: hypothetical protein VLU25_08420 [Acidobacteriota bacterium]|nr:hypothetical protein [Acidobacteriota bacterium]